jgi:hypothetical protein
MLKNILPIGVGRVVDLPAERQLDAAAGQVVADGAGVGHGPGEPVEFGHHEGVTFPDGREGLIEAGAVAGGAGEPVVEVDPVLGDAEFAQPVTLGGEVLGVGGAARVSDQRLGHDRERTDSPRHSRFSPDGLSATPQVQAAACG